MRISPLALALAAALAFGTTAVQAEPAAPLPDPLRPIRVAGVGLSVSDLERSMQFYTEVLGLKVAARVPAQGPAREYLLGVSGDVRTDALIVLRESAPPPGATAFGRVVLAVPDSRAMAERAAAAGHEPTRLADTVHVVRDPDGYAIELYQRPAAR
jgi:lactoylglutathione lyase